MPAFIKVLTPQFMFPNQISSEPLLIPDLSGGGHSALSTEFGLAADQTLEFEVVTAAGKLVTASRTQNTDLYWYVHRGVEIHLFGAVS